MAKEFQEIRNVYVNANGHGLGTDVKVITLCFMLAWEEYLRYYFLIPP